MYTSHRYSVSPTGCPPTLEFPDIACLCFNAVTSSTPLCFSDFLQPYSPPWSRHSCTCIRLLPLSPGRCQTGGDCATSRSGRLSGAQCHFTSGMQQPLKRFSSLSVVSLRPRISDSQFVIGLLPPSSFFFSFFFFFVFFFFFFFFFLCMLLFCCCTGCCCSCFVVHVVTPNIIRSGWLASKH